MFRKTLLLAALALFNLGSYAQNVDYASSIIDTLSSAEFDGRGYVNDGANRAAAYIRTKMVASGLKPMVTEHDYFHSFQFPVNTFPGAMDITLEQGKLKPGIDFIVSPACPSLHLRDVLVTKVTKARLEKRKTFRALKKSDWTNRALWVDTMTHSKKSKKRLTKVMTAYPNALRFESNTNLTWAVSTKQTTEAKILVDPSVSLDGARINVHVDADVIEYQARNVVGMIKGSEVPDSFVMMTGHYDHLGRMGKDTYIPGANDNASGIAMLFDFIDYFKQNPPRYSLVFIGFGGEEAGLIGSYYFVKDMDAFLDPDKIRFVVNMDLMGSGQEGVTAVNGAVFKDDFRMLEGINSEKQYLPLVKMRGKAANSDHYFFSERGIPAFFLYLMGPYAYYHEVKDSAENLQLEEKAYNNSFRLIRDFTKALMHQD